MKTKAILFIWAICTLTTSCEPNFDLNLFGDSGCFGCGMSNPAPIAPDLHVAGTYLISSIDEGIRHFTKYSEGSVDNAPFEFESYPISFASLELLKDSSFIITPEEDDHDLLYGHYKHGSDFYLNENKITGDNIALFFVNETFNDTLIISHGNYDIYYFTQHTAVYVKDGEKVSTSKGFGMYYWNNNAFNPQIYDEVFAKRITYTIDRYQ